jgi:tRNA (guanosine-2'-O-)-methyltransferase
LARAGLAPRIGNEGRGIRGYFGIGIENCKTGQNVGTLWRSAHNLGATFIFTIGNRYRYQGSDTSKAWRSIPLFQYPTFDDFYANLPHDCPLIGVNYPYEKAKPLAGTREPIAQTRWFSASSSPLSARHCRHASTTSRDRWRKT